MRRYGPDGPPAPGAGTLIAGAGGMTAVGGRPGVGTGGIAGGGADDELVVDD